MSKGDLRSAAERIERGIDRYARGDLAASVVEFEEAHCLLLYHSQGKESNQSDS